MTIKKEDFWKAMDECFVRWPKLKDEADVYYSRLSFMRLSVFQDICNKLIDTSRYMPLPDDFKKAYNEWNRQSAIDRPRGNENFKMIYGAVCKKCNRKRNVLIQEPVGSNTICRQCYTGLTIEETQLRFKDIFKMIANKDFEPTWVKILRESNVPF